MKKEYIQKQIEKLYETLGDIEEHVTGHYEPGVVLTDGEVTIFDHISNITDLVYKLEIDTEEM